MENIKIIVVGYKGKMGSVVFERLKIEGFDVCGVGKNDNLNDYLQADVLIDFSTSKMSVESAKWCKTNNVKLIIGATGQTAKELEIIKEIGKTIPVVLCQNFSIGVAMLEKCLKNIDKKLISSVTIFEKHHRFKVDSPSGTALMLKEKVVNQTGIEPSVVSERGGKEVGFHSVSFYLENEVITFSHQAYSRQVFADGVVLAVKFVMQQKDGGVFGLEDIFDKFN